MRGEARKPDGRIRFSQRSYRERERRAMMEVAPWSGACGANGVNGAGVRGRGSQTVLSVEARAKAKG